ncbi:decaprenyl-phosphate phosphoribosyltransferase [Actinokineospora globicatena]|uniref:Decaprenyl-phosphate phosphoribosyltransferase n=1 Tax=Actinokineospora globicatena TaxID=103729 RepID=A0A9W6QNM7_9PSEU|nr:decaprenyl-phosphate phosphoribosyltransferase [Actinokineospora globicatena]GLW91960.1 decaprenyl-phosphate phosphoribosyltransferase [Actinokineospora globicatena]
MSDQATEHRTESGTPTARPGVVAGLVRTARPRQWVKNVLVLAAPFTANRIFEQDVLVAAVIAFAAFCLVSSSVYLVNDAIDVAADREHPTKRNRPIASGIVPVRLAYVAAAVLFVGSLGVSLLAGWQLTVVLAVYAAVQLGYCLGLKHQPVIDLCIVASGFLLRSIAGGVAAGIPLSQWFLLVTAFGSLFMVSGKRYAEIVLFEKTGAKIRASLSKYSSSYLRFVWATAAAIMITTYSLWAFEIRERNPHNSVWAVISIVPFVIAVLRYAVDVDGGHAGTPEDIALKDRVLQVLGFSWVACLALSIYL